MRKAQLSLESIDPDLRAAVEASREKKATDLVVLDLRGLTSFTDYFLLCTGSTSRQLKAIVDGIEESLTARRVKPDHVEGYPNGDWILMDYVDFIVHVFTPTSRAYYDLERLWGDAKRLAIAS